MKSQQIKFMALGGGQRVGASCYYMGLGNNHILLDCGIGYASGIKQNPVLNALLGVPGIYSLSQLSEIYISHAHLDHSGYLPDKLKNRVYYHPSDNGKEKEIKNYLKECWPQKER